MLEGHNQVTVQKAILCKSSEFFKAACNGDWKESKDRVINMEHYDEQDFLAYIHWLYTETLILDEDGSIAAKLSYIDPWTIDVYIAFECYLLGDFIGDLRFCNVLIDRVLHLFKDNDGVPGPGYTRDRWPKLPCESGLARMLVDFAAFSGGCHERK